MVRVYVALATLLTLALPAAAQVSNARSGMPWPSGANGGSGGMADLEALRGRPLDTRSVFPRFDTWGNMATDVGSRAIRGHAATGARVEVAIAMLPASHRGQHMACWQRKFDANVRQWGTALINAGLGDAIVRLGWEADRMGGYPWAVVAGKEAEYMGCWRKQVGVLRALPGANFVISWTMQGKGSRIARASTIYPGNDWVDVIGMNPYDRCPAVRTEADWARVRDAKFSNGDPAGPGSWLAFARGKGKKFAVPEWGLGSTSTVCSDAGFDNPLFIRKMHEMFRLNAPSIAYEGYFNAHGDGRPNGQPPARGESTRIAPATWNPTASAVYRDLW